ncbi:hypothetical protein AB7M74_010764 [Bradyrhizobium japonicum]
MILKLITWVGAGLLLLSSQVVAADTCPPPPSQIEKGIQADAELKIGALGKLVGLDAVGKVTPITENLFVKYPNADKLIIAQLIASTTCQLLLKSGLTGKDLTDAIEKLNASLLSLMIEQRQKEDETKPRTEWKLQDGDVALTNSGGPIKNLDVEVVVFIQTDLHWLKDGKNYGLNGRYGSQKPGVIIGRSEKGPNLVVLPLGTERNGFRAVIERVIEKSKPETVIDGISHMQNCLKVQYDDLFGGHYTDYRVDNIVATGGGHTWIEKFKFDECKEDYEKTKQYADSYRRGGGLGRFEFWSGNDENRIENVIANDISRQIERWKSDLAK